MDWNNASNVEHQSNESSEDLLKYLVDLEYWEKELKEKEVDLNLIETIPEGEAEIKFLDDDDEEEKQSSSSESSENEEEYGQQLAQLHKDMGNHFFKAGNYDSAIKSYTAGLQLDPENPLLAANRAMAFLKQKEFQAAEKDCTVCLSIDPAYVKAYFRRGIARKNLKKFSLAKDDFSKALELEPGNKEAQAELKKLSETCSAKNVYDTSVKGNLKAQDMRPQFVANQPIKISEESSKEIEVNNLSTKKIDCIFSSEFPAEPSYGITKVSKVKTTVSEMHEEAFFKSVENKIGKNVKSNLNGQKIPLNNASHTEEKVENMYKPHLPPVPINSFQFLSHWNEISSYPDLRYKYLKQFPPEKFPVFFKHDMEPTIFPELIETLSTSFIEYGDDVYVYMKYLTEIGRFETMILFLTDKEENDLKNIFDYIKRSGRLESEVSPVLKKYGV